ncbi:MAG TPA: hypothetical protein VEF89_30080 [Solirubrobacteraceae bacterium]|nr:hypothetical protein [Solirubrobacteraceae bacterium]
MIATASPGSRPVGDRLGFGGSTDALRPVGFLFREVFGSLWWWTGGVPSGELAIGAAIRAMDAADVEVGILAAWRSPAGGGS